MVKFVANASDLHRVCVCLAATGAETVGSRDDSVRIDVTRRRLEITVGGASSTVPAEVQRTGLASIPFTVLAGVLHMLPYFGNQPVEIAFSLGKMRVDDTVFHNRSIIVIGPRTCERRRSSLKYRGLQPA
jgi:hypothetical protein